MRALSFLIALAFCGSALPAAAQYRESTPDVAAPPPARFDPREMELARARAAYNAAGTPRVVVFWNRELSDRISNDCDQVTIDRGTNEVGIATGVSRNRRFAAGAQVSSYEAETRQGRREVESDEREGVLSESQEWRFLDAFENRLRTIGLAMVDRKLAMRKLAATQAADADKQTIEMLGIADLCDVVLTVLQTPDPDAPVGVLFRITATRLSDGVTIATITGGGEGRSMGPGRFVAGADGFERVRPAAVGVEDAGRNLAQSVLVALSGAWD